MSILLKKTYQNPFVELYYEQKNATVIGWRELCERGSSDSMQEMMLRIYTKNYCKTKYPSRRCAVRWYPQGRQECAQDNDR